MLLSSLQYINALFPKSRHTLSKFTFAVTLLNLMDIPAELMSLSLKARGKEHHRYQFARQ